MAGSILKIHTQNGDIPIGYPGLADKPIADKTLSEEGAFADSKAVGDKFKEVKTETDLLKEDLLMVQEQAESHFDVLVGQMSEREGVTEQLKEENQMLWVQKINNIRTRAEEIVGEEIIYCNG